MNTLVTTRSADETRAFAGKLMKQMPGTRIFALYGGLGSGKTCFAQGLASELGISQAVTSPTFTLIREYRGVVPLFHIDLYRLNSIQDALNIGLEEYLKGSGIVAVEWAERAEELLPPETVRVRFTPLPDSESRLISVESSNS